MNRKLSFLVGLGMIIGPTVVSMGHADESVDLPRPVPSTRPEMKHLLEDMKQRSERIPLPELSEKDLAELGDRAGNYESRLRHHYLPASEGSVFGGHRRGWGDKPGTIQGPSRDFQRNADENMSLTYAFKTQLFWIVARTNNCQYCLGHQEWKLSETGMTDDAIASLDSNWAVYGEAEQAAFKYGRLLTYEPHKLSDEVIAEVLKFYTPLQILEMTLSVCGNNAINRWKEGAGIPQSSGNTFSRRAEAGSAIYSTTTHSDTFQTPTSEMYRSVRSMVAPLEMIDGKPTGRGISTRPKLETREEVKAQFETLRSRQPRLPLIGESDARQWIEQVKSDLAVSHWVRLIANFTNEGQSRLPSLSNREKQTGELTVLQKAQINWITARQDRAWYAANQAMNTLVSLGQSEEDVFSLDGDWASFTPADQAMFRFARHLAASPIASTDADAADVMKQASPRHLVQLINHVSACAYFNRLTEAASLPSD
jgi:alkylhydroperoxidase family enzyme